MAANDRLEPGPACASSTSRTGRSCRRSSRRAPAPPVYPPHDEVFAALHLTPYADTRVLILGQDPYHGPGQAHGLCFSVRDGGSPCPPSLVNIHKELQRRPRHRPPRPRQPRGVGPQGVLLLNTTLTVRAGQAASHQGKGWETFTDEVIRAVNAKDHPVVFILWGATPAARRR